MTTTTELPPKPTCAAPILDNIPDEIRQENRWVVWRYTQKSKADGSTYWTKVPFRSDGRGTASANDATTWNTFDAAVRCHALGDYDGIGFELGDGWSGLDFDDCLNEEERFTWGNEIVASFDTYGEISPSGTGCKMLLRGVKPEWAKCKRPGMGPDGMGVLEVFDHGRFFAFTGQILEGKPCEVRDCSAKLESLCDQYLRRDSKSESSHNEQKQKGPAENDAQYRRCLASMIILNIVDGEDGSRRLHAAACRCVEHALSDPDAIRCIRDYNKVKPFPVIWSDEDITRRLRDAERVAEKGKVAEAESPIESVSVGRLLKDFPELHKPLIDRVLRMKETCNGIAAAKVGKTHIAIDLSLCVGTGRAWLGRYEIANPGPVLYVDCELHPNTLSRRIASICSARGIYSGEIEGKLDVLSLRGKLRDIFRLRSWFADNAKDKYHLIVLDALYRLIPEGIDENSNSDMTRVFNAVDQIAETTGAAVLVIHHASKGVQAGKSVVDVGAGASAMARATDTHLIFRQHEQDDCIVMDMAARSWPPLQPVALRWNYPVWNIDDTLDPTQLRQENKRKRKEETDATIEPKIVWTPEKFAETFITAEPRTEAIIISAATVAELSERKAKRFLDAGVDAGAVHKWVYQDRKKSYRFANIPQPVTATGSGVANG